MNQLLQWKLPGSFVTLLLEIDASEELMQRNLPDVETVELDTVVLPTVACKMGELLIIILCG